MEDTTVSTKKKSGTEKISEKKRKAPKAPTFESEPVDDVQTAPIADQEVPRKSKKKQAPKIEIDDEPIVLEEPVKKKKSKAPKPPLIEDDFQLVEAPTIEELETPMERKRKSKKSKKSKKVISQPSLDDPQPTDYDLNSENYVNPNPVDGLLPPENDSSEYERTILDSYSNLASKINFAEYVGNDQWCIINLPKTARPEPKSRIRKMLPGGNKDEKPTGKPPVPKGSLLTRFRNGMNTLVRDEKNLLFGERADYELAVMEDEDDGVDTDDLHRYAQKLRELEDQDREVNPEFLVLRDGKTVYGVHESDADGKIKLSTRKPIYDRQSDQKPDEQSGKKTIISYLKMPFGRNKDAKNTKSANTTPDSRLNRKSSRKSLADDLTTTADL